MRKILAILLATFLLVGCPDGRFVKKEFTSPDCGLVTGYTITGIGYGDSKMIVVPLSKIRAGTEWRFYLKPEKKRGQPPVHAANHVTIDGKDSPGPNDWIFVEGTWDGSGSKHYLVECVPATAVTGETFEYLVDVDKVGELDPRAKVQ